MDKTEGRESLSKRVIQHTARPKIGSPRVFDRAARQNDRSIQVVSVRGDRRRPARRTKGRPPHHRHAIGCDPMAAVAPATGPGRSGYSRLRLKDLAAITDKLGADWQSELFQRR